MAIITITKQVKQGDSVSIKTTPNTGYEFNSYSGSINGTTTGGRTQENGNNPLSFNASTNSNITANFKSANEGRIEIRWYNSVNEPGYGYITRTSASLNTTNKRGVDRIGDYGNAISISGTLNSGRWTGYYEGNIAGFAISDISSVGFTEEGGVYPGSSRSNVYYADFSACTSMTQFGNSGNDQQFYYHNTIETVKLPSSIQSIYFTAFSSSAIRTLYIYATTPPVITGTQYSSGDILFSGCSNLRRIYVPAGSVSAYKSATAWSYYADKIASIQEVSITVDPAGSSSVSKSSSATSELPNTESSLTDGLILTATPEDGYKFVSWKRGSTTISTSNPYTLYSIDNSSGQDNITALSSLLSLDINTNNPTSVVLTNNNNQTYTLNLSAGENKYTGNVSGFELDNLKTISNVNGASGDDNLVSVDARDTSITYMGQYAFTSCDNLTTFKFPNTLTSIEDGAFQECTSLTTFTIPSSVINISKYSFYNTGWWNNQTNNSVIYKDNICFGHKGNINSDITITSGTRLIAADSFISSGLTSVVIPSGVERILSGAFQYCSSLVSANIPSSVIYVGVGAFWETGIFNNTLQNSNYFILDNCLLNLKESWAPTATEINIDSSVRLIAVQCCNLALNATAYNFSSSTPPIVNTYGLSNTWSATGVSDTPIYVPAASVNAYKTATTGMSYYESMIYPDNQNYTISTSVNPNGGGTVSGGGSIKVAQTCTLTATAANSNYVFVNWTENGVEVSTNSTYSFTVSGNRTLVANFGQTYMIYSQQYSHGTASGYGRYPAGATCTMTATPDTGYEFVSWKHDNTVISYDNPYSFTVSEEYYLGPVFSLASYTISASASPSGYGTVSGGGSKNYGTTCTLTATANSGYSFLNWTEGGTVVSTSASYSFTVNSARTLVANFTSTPKYNISASVSPSGSGSVSGGGSIYQGETCTLTATASGSYAFSSWSENGAEVSTSNPYSFTVSGARTLVANFEQITPITITTRGTGSVILTNNSDETYTWNLTSGTNTYSGSVSGFELNNLKSIKKTESYSTETTYITGVDISGTSITEIPQYGFSKCTYLTSITLPNTLTELKYWAFYGCTSLASITLPNSLVYIRGAAFYNNPLTSITIPASVKRIDSDAFKKTQISSFTIPSTVEEISRTAFDSTPWWNGLSDATIYKDNICFGYKTTKPTGALSITSGTRMIASGAFSFCTGLTSVSLPNSTTIICDSAFYDSTAISSYSLPKVQHIGTTAFRTNTALTSITLPNTLTYLDKNAFTSCYNLEYIHFSGTTPPPDGNFNNSTKGPALMVPNSSAVATYKAAWPSLQSRIFAEGTTLYKTTVNMSPSGAGTISGTGMYAYGDTCKLTASTSRYNFSKWTNSGGTTLSTDNPYSFTVSGNSTINAIFTTKPGSFTEASTTGPTGSTSTYGSGTVYIQLNGTTIATYVFSSSGWTITKSGTWPKTFNVGDKLWINTQSWTFKSAYSIGVYMGYSTLVLEKANRGTDYYTIEDSFSGSNVYLYVGIKNRY